MLIVYCWATSDHKSSSLKRHIFMISQSCKSEVWVSRSSAGCPALKGAQAKVSAAPYSLLGALHTNLPPSSVRLSAKFRFSRSDCGLCLLAGCQPGLGLCSFWLSASFSCFPCTPSSNHGESSPFQAPNLSHFLFCLISLTPAEESALPFPVFRLGHSR